MKIALIGDGKTGHHLIDLIGSQSLVGPFNLEHPINENMTELCQADVVVVFTPGSAVKALVQPLLESSLPVIWGSTGFNWPDRTHETLIKKGITWIHASNFSPGMILIKRVLNLFSKSSQLFEKPKFHLCETHHIQKKDAPSGTALNWQRWVNLAKNHPIKSIRVEDVIGIHELTIETVAETITLRHEVKDRSLFARGALLSAKEVLANKNLPKGILPFEKVASHILNSKNSTGN